MTVKLASIPDSAIDIDITGFMEPVNIPREVYSPSYFVTETKAIVGEQSPVSVEGWIKILTDLKDFLNKF